MAVAINALTCLYGHLTPTRTVAAGATRTACVRGDMWRARATTLQAHIAMARIRMAREAMACIGMAYMGMVCVV